MKELEEIIEDYKYIASSFKDSAPESFEITLKYIRQAHQSGIEAALEEKRDILIKLQTKINMLENPDWLIKRCEVQATILIDQFLNENAIKSLLKEKE